MAAMTAKKLKELMERVEHWPPEAQEEALASLQNDRGGIRPSA